MKEDLVTTEQSLFVLRVIHASQQR
ncbi:hypothetical protein HKBW3C_01903, partial [Candidatus Hakubella thermalkaliphila]